MILPALRLRRSRRLPGRRKKRDHAGPPCPARPACQCRSRKPINAVVVQETDRLARNTHDHLTIRAVLQKAGVKLISVAQPMLDDSPEGKMIDTILASVNQFQSDINSRKRGRPCRKSSTRAGGRVGRLLGYVNVAPKREWARTKGAERPIEESEILGLAARGLPTLFSPGTTQPTNSATAPRKGAPIKDGEKDPSQRHGPHPQESVLRRPHGLEGTAAHGPTRADDQPLQSTERILEIIEAPQPARQSHPQAPLSAARFCVLRPLRTPLHGRDPPAKRSPTITAAPKAQTQQPESKRRGRPTWNGRSRSGSRPSNSAATSLTASSPTSTASRRAQAGHPGQKASPAQSAEGPRSQARPGRGETTGRDPRGPRLREGARPARGIDRTDQDHLLDLDRHNTADVDVIRQVLALASNICEAYRKAPVALKREYLGLFWDRFVVKDREIVKAIPTELIRPPCMQNRRF